MRHTQFMVQVRMPSISHVVDALYTSVCSLFNHMLAALALGATGRRHVGFPHTWLLFGHGFISLLVAPALCYPRRGTGGYAWTSWCTRCNCRLHLIFGGGVDDRRCNCRMHTLFSLAVVGGGGGAAFGIIAFVFAFVFTFVFVFFIRAIVEAKLAGRARWIGAEFQSVYHPSLLHFRKASLLGIPECIVFDAPEPSVCA